MQFTNSKMRCLTRKFSQLFKRREDESPETKPTENIAEFDETGLKLLYNGSNAKVDIVAVHGLNGHREKSWTASNGVNWLQRLLPSDLPDSRIYTWGYDTQSTNIGSQVPVFQTISERLVEELCNVRGLDETHSRPIIFIAHSQGGTVVKGAILYSASKEPTDATPSATNLNLRSISLSTRGTIFMGTPELDSRLDGLKKFISLLEKSPQQQNADFEEARWMMSVLERYSLIANEYRTCFAYESTQPQDSPDRETPPSFQRLSPHILINSSHGGMIKYESSCDYAYVEIKTMLFDMVQSGPL